MVIIRIWGGIGNQLFQYVFGEYLRYRYNLEVKYDDGSYNSVDTLRKRELDILDAEIDYDSSYSFSQCRGIKNRILRTIFNLTPKRHLIIENSKDIPITFKENHIYYFQGYWQSIKYYRWLKANVPNFKLNSKEKIKAIRNYMNMIEMYNESVSLHIRRGDYFSPQNIKVYGVCTKDYYCNALNYIYGILDKVKVFVFSDDIEWVHNNINLPDDAVIISNYDIPQFMYIELMSHCKHHILSNSSFSWWGAVLKEHDNSIVISPNKWTLTSKHTLSLDKWIKIHS